MNNTFELYRSYLNLDQTEYNLVKLSMYSAPYELVGYIRSVSETDFIMKLTNEEYITCEIKDILHYRMG